MKFLIMISMVFVLGCQDRKYLRIDTEKESGSMVSMRNFSRIFYNQEGKLEWKLKGKESYIYPTDNRTIVYGFEFYQYENGKYKSYLTGARGEINHSTKTVVLEGDVNLKTEDGNLLKSETLNYNLDDKTLSTDSEVLIYSDGTTIRGKGLRADRGLNKYTVLKPSAVTVGGTSPLKEK